METRQCLQILGLYGYGKKSQEWQGLRSLWGLSLPLFSYLWVDAYQCISSGIELLFQGNDYHLKLFLTLLFDVT